MSFEINNSVLNKYIADDATEIVIPESVTSIGEYAFARCENLVSITIPDSVTEIGNGAFRGCENLTSIVIPNSVTEIADYVFEYCESLTSVTLPDGLTGIGTMAFEKCIKLKSINIPATVKKIGADAFSGCKSLKIVDIDDINAFVKIEFCSYDTKFNSNPINYAKCLTKNGKPITEIVLEEGIERIPYGVFTKYKKLKSITIPSSVKEIDSNAFEMCTDLDVINIYDLKKWMSINSNRKYEQENIFGTSYDLYIDGDLVTECTYHSENELRDGNIMSYCNSIKTITIPDSITKVGEKAFDGCWYSCQYIENVNASVEFIKESFACLKNTKWFKNNLCEENGVTYFGDVLYKYDKWKSDKNIKVKAGTTRIYKGAFSKVNVENLYLPNSLRCVEHNAFAWETVIENLHISSIADWLYIDFEDYCTPMSKAKKVFVNGEELSEIIIPDGVTKILPYAFYRCESLKTVKIPNSVVEIGKCAFGQCPSLEKVYIPESVTTIAYETYGESFGGNENITFYTSISSGAARYAKEKGYKVVVEGAESENASPFVIEDGVLTQYVNINGDETVEIPNHVTIIGDKAFNGVDNIKKVIIPDSVKSIGGWAFSACTSLTSVIIPNSVTDINGYAFEGCTGLTSITIPNSVTNIGVSVFKDCTSLTTITIPDSVTQISWGLFDTCTSLTSVTIPDSVIEICKYAFKDCACLTSITIPDGVQKIDGEAFEKCTSLESISIPDSATLIPNMHAWMFDGCSSLKNFKASKNDAYVQIRNKPNLETFDLWISEESSHYFDKYYSTYSQLLILHGKRDEIKKHDIPDATVIVAPEIAYSCFKEASHKFAALLGYLSRTEHYTEQTVIDSYEEYFLKSKKKLLEVAFKNDDAGIIEKLVKSGKANAKNIDKEFIEPAQTANAHECVAFLLDWQSKNISVKEKEKEELKAFEKELTRDPNSKAEMKKRFNFKEQEDGTVEVTSYKDKENLDVVIPDEICGKKVTSVNFVNSFPLKKSIKSIVLPKWTKEIPSKCFANCSSLESVVLPNKVKYISSYAFLDCRSLKNIAIPDSVTFIGSRAFEGCVNLSSITMGSGVETIGEYTFKDCIALTTLKFSNKLSRIGQRAFYNCRNLGDIYFESQDIIIENGIFQYCNQWVMKVHGPEGSSIQAYAKKAKTKFIAE